MGKDRTDHLLAVAKSLLEQAELPNQANTQRTREQLLRSIDAELAPANPRYRLYCERATDNDQVVTVERIGGSIRMFTSREVLLSAEQATDIATSLLAAVYASEWGDG